MSLPKLQQPTYTITDHLGKKWSFRPMLVKEEKILLMAKESKEDVDILRAIKQIVSNCSLDKKLDIDKVPLFDLEHFFLKIRGFSVGEEVNVAYRDVDDNKSYSFKILISDIHLKIPENIVKKIPISGKAGVVMKYPEAALYDDKKYLETQNEDALYNLAARCIDIVYDGEHVYERKDFTNEDLLEFIELMDIKSFQKIKEFLSNLPTLYYKIEYENFNKSKRTIELTSLSDFFSLR